LGLSSAKLTWIPLDGVLGAKIRALSGWVLGGAHLLAVTPKNFGDTWAGKSTRAKAASVENELEEPSGAHFTRLPIGCEG
jgi:hypothetical protein